MMRLMMVIGILTSRPCIPSPDLHHSIITYVCWRVDHSAQLKEFDQAQCCKYHDAYCTIACSPPFDMYVMNSPLDEILGKYLLSEDCQIVQKMKERILLYLRQSGRVCDQKLE